MENIFGKNLKMLRLRSDLQQEDLAALVWPDRNPATSRAQIYRYERGLQTPRTDTQQTLAKALKCTVADLWRESGPEPISSAPPAPADELAAHPEHHEQFEAWAGDQLLELARRSMSQVRVAVAERDQYKNEAMVLRAEVARLRLELAAQIRLNQEARDRISLLEGTSVPTERDQAPVGLVQEGGSAPRDNENGERGK